MSTVLITGLVQLIAPNPTGYEIVIGDQKVALPYELSCCPRCWVSKLCCRSHDATLVYDGTPKAGAGSIPSSSGVIDRHFPHKGDSRGNHRPDMLIRHAPLFDLRPYLI